MPSIYGETICSLKIRINYWAEVGIAKKEETICWSDWDRQDGYASRQYSEYHT